MVADDAGYLKDEGENGEKEEEDERDEMERSELSSDGQMGCRSEQ